MVGGGDVDIRVEGLRKTFRVPEREAGLRASMRSLVRRTHRDVHAVADVLSGLLVPSGGTADVLGHVPWQRDHDCLRRMTLVMGNRNQLQWDIPALDSFELNRAASG